MHCENYLPAVSLSSLCSLTPVRPCWVQVQQLPALWISAIHPPAMTRTIFLKSKYHLVILSRLQVHSPAGLLLYPKVTISGPQSGLYSLIHPNLRVLSFCLEQTTYPALWMVSSYLFFKSLGLLWRSLLPRTPTLD